MNITLQTSASEPNKLDKVIFDVLSVDGTLKDYTSIINPSIIIQANLEEISAVNYMTVESFHRSYFVTDIVSITKDLVQITGHVDVLSTYKDGIRSNNGVVHRQANTNNLYLNDGSLVTYQDTVTTTKLFSNSSTCFSGDDFVIAVAGNT